MNDEDPYISYHISCFVVHPIHQHCTTLSYIVLYRHFPNSFINLLFCMQSHIHIPSLIMLYVSYSVQVSFSSFSFAYVFPYMIE
jgi:hypothetical protein